MAIGGGLSAVLWTFLPRSLNVRTDVLGYPTFANFDVNTYTYTYLVLVVAWPLLSTLAYASLDLVWRRLLPAASKDTSVRLGAPEAVERDGGAPTGGLAVGLSVACSVPLAAGTVGVESAVVRMGEGATALVGAAAALAYGITVLGVGVALWWWPRRMNSVTISGLGRARGSLWARVANVNAYGSLATVLLLFVISMRTGVEVSRLGIVRLYPWLPVWLLLAFLAVGLVVIVRSQRDSERAAGSLLAQRAAMLWIVGPVLIFLGTAVLPGAIGVSTFEGGQQAASGYLILAHHVVPWKELQFIHGLLGDPLAGILGLVVFGRTNWGYTAGLSFLLNPICWIALYAFTARLFGRHPSFVVLIGLAMVVEAVVAPGVRFLFYPVQLVVLYEALRTHSRIAIVGLSVLTVLQVAITPETAYAAIAVYGTVIAADAYSHFVPGSSSQRRGWMASRWLLISSVASTGILAGILYELSALRGFVEYYVIVAPEHALTGGIPITWLGSVKTDVWALLPVVLVLASIAMFLDCVSRRRPVGAADWVLFAAAGFVLLYYTKELARDDQPHVIEVLWVTLPLAIMWLHHVLEWAGGRIVGRVSFNPNLRALPRRGLLAVLVLLAVVVTPAAGQRLEMTGIVTSLSSITRHFRPTVEDPAPAARLGYVQSGAIDINMLGGLRRILDYYAGTSAPVFDFSNAPLVFYFLLNREPGTEFFQVSMAQPLVAQQQLVSELRASQPPVVIFESASIGLSSWDGLPNMVRHYTISQYILDAYRPVVLFDGELVMIRPSALRSRGVPRWLGRSGVTALAELYESGPACSWGDTPSFMSKPVLGASNGAKVLRAVPLRVERSVTVTGWAVSADARHPARLVVATVGRHVVGEAKPTEARPDVASALGEPGVLDSGFVLRIPWRSSYGPLRRLNVYSLTGRTLEPLSDGASAGATLFSVRPRIVHNQAPGGSLAVRRSTRPAGVAEKVTLSPRFAYRLAVPTGLALADYRTIYVSFKQPLPASEFVLGGSPDPLPRQEITFGWAGGNRREVAVPVGSCLQWHGYSTDDLFLGTSAADPIVRVALAQ